MRPKFRAYDSGSLSRMYQPDEVMVCDGRIWIQDEDSEGNEWIVNNDLNLMQSTGLFDKHNKEIFEGDILKSNKYITSVFYERGAYCVKFCRTTNTTVTMNVISFIEKYKTKVIGNIYENKGILEGDK
nr:MAG TPA: YopX protein [Caudoviricetes sp.]